MRVLHIIVALEIGGAELMLRRLVVPPNSAERNDFQHEVISLTRIGPVGHMLQAEGVPVTELGLSGVSDLLRVWRELVLRIRSSEAPIVQTWMYHADLLGGLAARAAGKHVVWGVRTTSVGAGNSRSTRVLRRICALLSKSVPDLIVCAAEASRAAHVKAGYAADRMRVIPNGFDVPDEKGMRVEREALRIRCDLAPGEWLVGCAGRFNPDKDFLNFVRAAGLVVAQVPSVVFIMIGRGLDASNTELQTWIREHGGGARFILFGERTPLTDYLPALDLFVLSSVTEGFPNVVGEAMAARVPCVVTRAGDAPLLVGDTGWTVPVRDSAALGRAITQALENRAELHKRAGEARNRIIDSYSMNRCRSEFAKVYGGLTEHDKERA